MSDRALLHLCDLISGKAPAEHVAQAVFRAAGGLLAVFRNEDQAIVCVRGAGAPDAVDRRRNALDVLTSGPRKGDPLLLHKGVLRHAQRFVARGLDLRTFRRVTFCGMSLGGATATVLPLVVPLSGDFEVVTFGALLSTKAPGKVEGVLRAKGMTRAKNYVMRGDSFAALPLAPGWSHVGEVVMLPRVVGPEHSRARYMEALNG